MAFNLNTNEIYINSHITDVIKERFDYCLRSAGRNSPSGLIIEGPTGLGKTTTCIKEQTAINQRYEAEGLPPPVYLVLSPTQPSTKDYYSEILASLGDLSPYVGTLQQLRERLYAQLKSKQVKMLIFDEFQQLVEKRSPKVVRQTLDDIKLIADKFKIACVFVGTSGVKEIASNNEQAASRYANTITLSYMRFDSSKRQAITRKFIVSFFKAHGLKGLNMDEYENTLRMYAATNGDLRLFVHLLDDASGFLTDANNIKPVTLKALARSYGFLNNPVRKIRFNPFLVDMATIENELKVTNLSIE